MADVERAAAPRAAALSSAPHPRRPAAARAGARSGAARRSGGRDAPAIAAAMARSKREIPHYYLATTIDMGRALAWLEAENRTRPVTERLLPAALLLHAVALAAREVPEVNGHYVDDAFRPGERVNVGVAISLRGGGLVAPAIHDVDRLSLDDLIAAPARPRQARPRRRAAQLGDRRRDDHRDQSRRAGGRDRLRRHLSAAGRPRRLRQGRRAAVGRGGDDRRPPTVTASLAADHRVSDGHRGGRFLAAIDRLLQEPEKL